jgi:hypothetical protein
VKVPVSWLREYVAFTAPIEEVADRLAVASAEVDRITRRGVPDANGNLGRFVVGRPRPGMEPDEVVPGHKSCRVVLGHPGGICGPAHTSGGETHGRP